MTEEEIMNESKMTYGPKNNKSSVDVRPAEKQVVQPVCFESKGTFDSNVSSSCADEVPEVPEVMWGDIFGNEPDSNSDFSKNSINETASESVFGSNFFTSLFGSFSVDNNCDVSCSTATEAEQTNESESEDQQCSDYSSETVSVNVPDNVSCGTTETHSQTDQETSLKNKAASEPFLNTNGSCADNSSNDSAKVSGISSDKPELSDSVKADDMKNEEKTVVKKAPNAQAEQSEPSVSGEKIQIKQQEPKQAGKGRGNKKPKHQRQAGSPQSSTGNNSPQKARDMRNAFVKPVSNGKCEKYEFDCANKAFGKTGEISEHDVQSTQNKKTQKKSPPQKAPANDKYRHPSSSSSAGKVQQKQAQKGPVHPSGPARATQADQNAFYVKRQTCFNCGITGHIARNCTNRPYVPYYMQNQRVTPKGNYHSKPMKVSSPKAMKNVNPTVKPSDGDWNAAKAKRKQALKPTKISKNNKVDKPNVLPKASKKLEKPKQIWRAKQKAATSPILETKGDLCLKEVSYFDASGNPRTTMAWVPMSY
ncbi:putative transcription factor interactor and regulator CCHC(Zn) family [Helianthus annuus]|nr:putative transcription factor interactor and regulator CCHC(Zn) family [Helianthus annuus]